MRRVTGLARMAMSVRRRRVLVIDGDRDARAVVDQWLGALGCVVLHATSRDRGLAATLLFQPDVICLDVGAGGSADLQRLVPLHQRHPLVPVIVIMADAPREAIRKAWARGAFACLFRPLDGPQLVATLVTALGGRRVEATPARAVTG